ncbi:MAG: hypothetical protein U0637_08290 [Phycisphaerales bacterium]
MFPCNTNTPWNANNPFNPALTTNPYFAQTLTLLINQAVQQAVWQTMLMQQWQNTQNFTPTFPQPWPQQWSNNQAPFPQWNAQWTNPTANNNPNYPQPYQPQTNFGQAFNPTQGGWMNAPGYFGTVQFQQTAHPQHTPTNEVVEAATKRNGSR